MNKSVVESKLTGQQCASLNPRLPSGTPAGVRLFTSRMFSALIAMERIGAPVTVGLGRIPTANRLMTSGFRTSSDSNRSNLGAPLTPGN